MYEYDCRRLAVDFVGILGILVSGISHISNKVLSLKKWCPHHQFINNGIRIHSTLTFSITRIILYIDLLL